MARGRGGGGVSTRTPFHRQGRLDARPARGPRVVENAEFTAFGRRILRAAGRRVAAGDVDALPALAALGGRAGRRHRRRGGRAARRPATAGGRSPPGSGSPGRPPTNAGRPSLPRRPTPARPALLPRRRSGGRRDVRTARRPRPRARGRVVGAARARPGADQAAGGRRRGRGGVRRRLAAGQGRVEDRAVAGPALAHHPHHGRRRRLVALARAAPPWPSPSPWSRSGSLLWWWRGPGVVRAVGRAGGGGRGGSAGSSTPRGCPAGCAPAGSPSPTRASPSRCRSPRSGAPRCSPRSGRGGTRCRGWSGCGRGRRGTRSASGSSPGRPRRSSTRPPAPSPSPAGWPAVRSASSARGWCRSTTSAATGSADVVSCRDLADPRRRAPGTDIDLRKVWSGRTEYGTDWLQPLAGGHTLTAGATGAGKNSVGWCPIVSIAPAIRDGLVRVSGIDPKGMELAYGRRIFHRYAVTSQATRSPCWTT